MIATAPQVMTGTAQADSLSGLTANESISGFAGDDTLAGAGGNDTVDGGAGSDRATFSGKRAEYAVTKVAGGATVADTVSARDGTDLAQNVESLRFSDCTVDLTMARHIANLLPADVKTLEELYVGFFDRVPEASGLAYWLDQLKAGTSLASIANQFYDAGVQFGIYSASMTNQQFIEAIYANVLARPQGSFHAPDTSEIGYWNARLVSGQDTKGTMVLTMLHDVHTQFEYDPYLGFVAASLNNKATVAHYYAVQQGLSLNVQADNIAYGIELASKITPWGTAAAIDLIGVYDAVN